MACNCGKTAQPAKQEQGNKDEHGREVHKLNGKDYVIKKSDAK